jgi:hypothetical protein
MIKENVPRFSNPSDYERTLDQETLLDGVSPRFDRRESNYSLLVMILSVICLRISGVLWLSYLHFSDLDRICSVYTSQYRECSSRGFSCLRLLTILLRLSHTG